MPTDRDRVDGCNSIIVNDMQVISGIAADKKAPAAKPAEAAKAAPAEKKAEPAAKQELLDISTASEADLKALAGIGDAYRRGRPPLSG